MPEKRKTKPTKKLLESKFKITRVPSNQENDKENIAPKSNKRAIDISEEDKSNKKAKEDSSLTDETGLDLFNLDATFMDLENEDFLDGIPTPTPSGATPNEEEGLGDIYLSSLIVNGDDFSFTPDRDFGNTDAPNSLFQGNEAEGEQVYLSPISLTEAFEFFASPEAIEIRRQNTPEFDSPQSDVPTEIDTVLDSPNSDVPTEIDTVLDTPNSDVPTEIDEESNASGTLNYSPDEYNFEPRNGSYISDSSNSTSSSQGSLLGLNFSLELLDDEMLGETPSYCMQDHSR